VSYDHEHAKGKELPCNVCNKPIAERCSVCQQRHREKNHR